MAEHGRGPSGRVPEEDLDLRRRFVGAFALDESDERFVEQLNASLAPFEEQGYADEIEETMPNLFVVGAPRSGTTLLVQLLASHLDVGWISNLAAAFWRAPCTGIRLHRQLLGDELRSSFDSRAGRTEAIAEPHEFGYFWTRLLGHGLAEPEGGTAVDWHTARRTLLHMNLAWGRPIVYKAFQLGYHVNEIVASMPRSVFLHLRRDPVDAALSLLRTRVALTGSDETWISLKPRGWESVRDRSPAEQVAWQVLRVEESITRRLRLVPRENVVELMYEDLADRPHDLLADVQRSLASQGYASRLRKAPDRFEAHGGDGTSERWVEVQAAVERLRERAP